MAKKRVHELAKELGYQNNRDLIDKLQKLGFEVKSHSSTVDEAEVRRALKKEEDERRARTDEQRVNTNVIRRRKKDGGKTIIRRRATPAPEPTPVVEAPAEPAEPVEAAAPVEAVEPVEAVADEAPAVEVAPEAPVVEAAAEAAPAEAPAEAAPAEAPTEATEAPAEVEAPEVEPKPEVVAADAEATPEADAEEPKKERREARTARPEVRTKREEPVDEDEEKPEMMLEDLGLSEADFASPDDERESAKEARVAPPPPSSKTVTQQQEESASKIVRKIDPAVLKARLASAKRPEPPKEWGKQDMPASPVTELVVRTDASGKRRELVDVRKEAARGRAGRAGQKRREEMSAKDLLEHRRGQVYYPTPNRKRMRGKGGKPARKAEPLAPLVKRPIQIGETITPTELANQMSRKATDIIRWLVKSGVMAGMNSPIDHDVAAMVSEEFGYEVTSKLFDEESRLAGKTADEVKEPIEDPNSVQRSPVVTVMGHVDHGKTSLLDHIRKANVADGEAGGITQGIAGYQVTTKRGTITFLDTPGHKAFTAMRARGANVTDIVVLVVAADDGVMPQTEEAIQHAKAAEVPLVVAVNKMDKADANPDRVLQQLSGYGVLVEEWGGEVLCKKISAKTGDGVDDLLETVLLQAELLELRANPTLPATGSVIEASVHKGRGPVATVLVQEGTLKVGDAVIVGEAIGKIRALLNDAGKRIKEAGPGVPVQILGLDGVPPPGEAVRVAHTLEAARELAAHRVQLRRETELAGKAKVSLQDLFARMGQGDQKELKIIIKADVQGSVEALRGSLSQLTNKQVRVTVIHGGVGAVTESDVEFARASEGVIIGFGVRPDTKAIKAARALGGVDIRSHSIIYECVDEVRKAMQGLLSPVSKEKYLGRAEVRQTFNVPKVGTVAGCFIVDGVVTRSAQIRVLRDSKEIYSGKLASLKRFKDDAREVKEGFECGMGVERFNDLKPGDIIESFEMIEVAAVLEDNTGSVEARI